MPAFLDGFRGLTWREIFIGTSHDYAGLFAFSWPFCRKEDRLPPTFFGVNDRIGVLWSIIMGLQHALAMVGGIITPAILIGALSPNVAIQQYLISTALIASGIFSAIHVISFVVPFTRGKVIYGTGILSVVGLAFNYLPTTLSAIKTLMAEGASFEEAYGRTLGTIMTTFWVPAMASFMSPKVLQRLFPPMVTGLCVFLVGTSLLTSGFQGWGGGSYCASNVGGLAPVAYGSNCTYTNTTTGAMMTAPGLCYQPQKFPLCTGNGDVKMPFGSAVYLGLGALVFLSLIVIEVFGSPFMRNVEVVLALLLGFFVAWLVRHNGKKFVLTAQIASAPGITFLWVHWFPLGFYAPAFLPFLCASVVSTIGSVGDVVATEEVSQLATTGSAHARRVKGGLLADGINIAVGGLMSVAPTTMYGQNNGVIALTGCASRWAGIAVAVWLILFGVIAKIGAWVNTIPACVLGGMTTFLFTSVSVSGIKVMTIDGFTRRTRFILALALGLGLGVQLVPAWATNNIWPPIPHASQAAQSFRTSVLLILGNGYTLGSLVAMILHLIIPFDQGTDDKYLLPMAQDPTLHGTKADAELYHKQHMAAMEAGLPDHEDSAHGRSGKHPEHAPANPKMERDDDEPYVG